MSKSSKIVLIFHTDNDIHSEDVANKCRDIGAEVFPFSINDLFLDITFSIHINDSVFDIKFKDKILTFKFSDIHSIYARDINIRKFHEESSIEDDLIYEEKRTALHGLLKCLENKFLVNKPWHEDLFDNKILQSKEAGKFGLRTPKTLITSQPLKFLEFYEKCNKKVVIKQLSEVCMIESLNSNIDMG